MSRTAAQERPRVAKSRQTIDFAWFFCLAFVSVLGWMGHARAQDGTEGAEGLAAPAPAPPREISTLPPPGAVPPPADGFAAPPSDATLPQTPPGYVGLPGSASRNFDTLVADVPSLQVPARIATRIRVLDRDYTALTLRGSNNVVDGILSILSGALSATIAFVIQAPSMQPYLLTYAGASVLRGVVDLTVTPNPQGVALQFAHMPMASAEEVRERLRFGEENLESLANMARIARILDGGISITAALAVVPAYMVPRNFAFNDVQDYFVAVVSAVSLVTGVITLVSGSDLERRWDSYVALRDRLATGPGRQGAQGEDVISARPAASLHVTGSLAPIPNGFIAGAAGTF